MTADTVTYQDPITDRARPAVPTVPTVPAVPAVPAVLIPPTPAETRAAHLARPSGWGWGATVWLTGLPSAGKSTVAEALAGRLRAEGHRVEVLDGDEMRTFISAGLGFSRADRDLNVRRIGFIAELLASHGVKVLVPVIAPYEQSRAAVAEWHAARGTDYLEVHVATPVEVCAERDVKGLYAKQAAGELRGLTGVDDPYESPRRPDLRIQTQGRSVGESAAAVHSALALRGLA